MLLTILSFFLLRTLSPELLGSDSYFGLSQGKYLAEHGHFKVPDRGLNYVITAGLIKLGVGDEDSVRFTQALILAFAFSISLAFIQLLSPRGSAINLLASVLAIAVLAPILFFHTIEFPKLTFGASVFLTSLILRKYRSVSLGLAICAGALHQALLPFVAAVAIFHVPRFAHRRVLTFGSFCFAILAITVYFINWTRAQEAFMAIATHPLSITTFFFRPEISLFLRTLCALLLVALGASTFLCLYSGKNKQALLGLALLVLLLPTSLAEPFGLGERFLVLTSLLAIPLITLQWHTIEDFRAPPLTFNLFAGFAIGLGSLSTILTVPRYDYTSIKQATEFLQSKPEKIVIARKPLKFYYTAITGRDSFSFSPEAGWNLNSIARVAIGIDRDEFIYYAGDVCPWGSQLVEMIPGTTWLWMKESCWQELKKRVSEDLDPSLYRRLHDDGLNPSHSRPKFLRERRYIRS